jgi:hypothetical protein
MVMCTPAEGWRPSQRNGRWLVQQAERATCLHVTAVGDAPGVPLCHWRPTGYRTSIISLVPPLALGLTQVPVSRLLSRLAGGSGQVNFPHPQPCSKVGRQHLPRCQTQAQPPQDLTGTAQCAYRRGTLLSCVACSRVCRKLACTASEARVAGQYA